MLLIVFGRTSSPEKSQPLKTSSAITVKFFGNLSSPFKAQPWKQLYPIDVIPSGRVSVPFRLSQYWKTLVGNLWTPCGIVILPVKLLHPLNAPSLISVSFSGNLNSPCKPSQPAKVLLPAMHSRLFGNMSSLVKPQYVNTPPYHQRSIPRPKYLSVLGSERVPFIERQS